MVLLREFKFSNRIQPYYIPLIWNTQTAWLNACVDNVMRAFYTRGSAVLSNKIIIPTIKLFLDILISENYSFWKTYINGNIRFRKRLLLGESGMINMRTSSNLAGNNSWLFIYFYLRSIIIVKLRSFDRGKCEYSCSCRYFSKTDREYWCLPYNAKNFILLWFCELMTCRIVASALTSSVHNRAPSQKRLTSHQANLPLYGINLH